MEENVTLRAIASAAAEFNVLGDDDNAVMIMRAADRLAWKARHSREAFDDARELYLKLRNFDFVDLPERPSTELAQKCMTELLTSVEEMLEGASLMVTCCNLLKDYWGITTTPPALKKN